MCLGEAVRLQVRRVGINCMCVVSISKAGVGGNIVQLSLVSIDHRGAFAIGWERLPSAYVQSGGVQVFFCYRREAGCYKRVIPFPDLSLIQSALSLV